MKKLVFLLGFLAVVFLFACSRNQSNGNMEQAHLQIKLTDSPFPDAKEVWVDVRDVEILMEGDKAIVLDFTNGKDTLIADAMIPAGKISQIRLILGDNNYIVTKANEQIALKTPSAQESGLKVQIHQDVTGGVLFLLLLDFDAGKSIVKAGNSGNYILKPVLRILSLEPSGGNIKGYVVPDSVRTLVLAIVGTDTVSSAFTDPAAFGAYLIKDVPAGSYNLSFLFFFTTFQTAYSTATVSLGQTTVVDTIRLQK